jgi:alpha 1,3-glucosidase
VLTISGPESVGLDITFPGFEHVYGIPEHATSLSLKETRGGDGNYNEPYRLYNSDVFEYETDSPMTLYGSIPFMQAQKKDVTVGVFWLNAAETWVDVTKQGLNPNALSNEKKTTQTHWFSESGLLDVFLLPGPSAAFIYEQYGSLTGYTSIPAEFSLGYHQCRWNYVSQEDVKDVDRNFDKFDIPYDVIWLDIEYTDGKKYFTWDPLAFKDPSSMLDNLKKRERKVGNPFQY